MNTPPDLATAALEYAARGWLVIPLHSPMVRGCSCGRAECASPAKHPRTVHGLKDASRDPATIREWWRRWPEANIAILTGPESGILVLDVDGKRGEESLIDFERRGLHLPDTWVVRTGGGGQHLYFIWPEGADVRNSQSKIAPGLDIRGLGGYAVAPPSLHSSGARYEVDESAIPLVCTPGWLLSLIQEQDARQGRQREPAPGPVIEHPHRTPHLVSLAGTMNKRGMRPAAIEAALLEENAATCFPPLQTEKVRAIARDIPARYPNPKSQPEVKPVLKPDLVCLADVEARAVDWLWKPFIPTGMLSMLSGDPGAGKSFIALAVAADLSCGKLRDGRIVEPASTLYLSVENPIAQSIRPRFDALGGNAAHFHVLKGTLHSADGEEQHGGVTLADISTLEAAISETSARLVIVDPIQSYLGASVDLHRSNETRPVMDGLSKLAESCGCAILLLRHLSKQYGGKAILRGLGSIDLTGAVRSEMLAGSLPDDPDARALVHIKSNVGRLGRALGYSIDGDGLFAWTGESTIKTDLLAAPAGPGDHKLDEASHWLAELLKPGSREAKEVIELATGEGISKATLYRAKNTLRVRSHKAAMKGPWHWTLPEDTHDFPEGAQAQSVSTFGNKHRGTAREVSENGNLNGFPQKVLMMSEKETLSTFAELSTFVSDCGGLLQ